MNELMIKRFHVSLIVIFMALGAGCLTASYKLFKNPVDIQKSAEQQIALRLYDACAESARRLGFQQEKSSTRDLINFSGRGLERPSVAFAQSSILIRDCAGYTMKEFCMGSDCESEIELTLESRLK